MDEATPVPDGQPQAPVEPSGGEAPQQGAPPSDTSQGHESGGAWPKEFQAEFTRWRQSEAARAEQERQSWSQKEQQYQQVVQQLVQRLQQGARPQPAEDPFATVKDLPYVDGQTLAQLLQQVQQGVQPVQQQVQQLAATLNLMARQNADLREQLGGIQGESASAKLASRFQKVRDQLGMPDNPVTQELLEDVYYSHEWNGLEEEEFPKYVQQRWDALRKLIRDADRSEALKARQSPFAKRGGEATPSQPLKADGYKTPDELTEELAPLLGLK